MDERSIDAALATGLSGAPDTWPLSARDAAGAIGVSERTIRRAIARGALVAARHAGVYRIAPGELARYRDRQPTSRRLALAGEAAVSTLPLARGGPLIGREPEVAVIEELLQRDAIPLLKF